MKRCGYFGVAAIPVECKQQHSRGLTKTGSVSCVKNSDIFSCCLADSVGAVKVGSRGPKVAVGQKKPLSVRMTRITLASR